MCEPTNKQRASWAKKALNTFATVTGMKYELKSDEVELVVSDLLADLMHFCDQKEINFGVCVERAEDHYSTERADEAKKRMQRRGKRPGSGRVDPEKPANDCLS